VLQRAAPEHAFPALPLLVGLVAPLLADSPVDWSRRSLDLGSNKIESVADVTWPSSLRYVSLLACCATKGSARARLPLPLLVGLVAPLLADSPVDWSCRSLALYNNQIENVTNVTWPSSLEYVSLLACSATEAASEHAFPALPLLVGLVAPLLFDSPVDWSRRLLSLSGNQIESVTNVKWPWSLGYVSLIACSAAEGSARARLPLPLLVGLVAPLLADSPPEATTIDNVTGYDVGEATEEIPIDSATQACETCPFVSYGANGQPANKYPFPGEQCFTHYECRSSTNHLHCQCKPRYYAYYMDPPTYNCTTFRIYFLIDPKTTHFEHLLLADIVEDSPDVSNELPGIQVNLFPESKSYVMMKDSIGAPSNNFLYILSLVLAVVEIPFLVLLLVLFCPLMANFREMVKDALNVSRRFNPLDGISHGKSSSNLWHIASGKKLSRIVQILLWILLLDSIQGATTRPNFDRSLECRDCSVAFILLPPTHIPLHSFVSDM